MAKANNLIGQRFGRLLVIDRSENDAHGKTRWLCKCDCGNEKVVGGAELRQGKTKSCGCAHYEKTTTIDLTGQRFGRLTVIERKYRKPIIASWLCRCDCGTYVIVDSGSLRGGQTRSCGCLRKEIVKEKATKHDLCHTKLYAVHSQMKQRCNNPNNKDCEYYGGRGIRICDEWSDVETFYSWAMGSGYREGLTIDRIDPNGNYCPENCRWITIQDQQRNRRPQKKIS